MTCNEILLAELYAVYDKLITGAKVVKITLDGETTEFNIGSIKELKARIAECERTLNAVTDPWSGEGTYLVTSSKGYGS